MNRLMPFAWKNIRRSPYQAISAITVLTVTFFIAQLFVLLTLGSQKILNYFETKPQISAYFTDETTESQILTYKHILEGSENIK